MSNQAAEALAGALPLQGQEQHTVHRLRKNAIGLTDVIFMTIATAAPITAMLGNVPIAVGSGNGHYAPAGYLVATIVLALFAIGYAEMAKQITATGAFYGFISKGIGRVVGMGAGYTITLTYMVFEAAVVGVFGFFANDLVISLFGLDVGWFFYSCLMILTNGILSHYDITLTAKVLGVCLVLEIAILTAVSLAVAFHGGGEQGFSFSSINPVNAFKAAEGVIGANAGIGLFFAFSSWVGFESSAMYGEESKNPKKIIPLATLLTVVGIGIFYVLVSWMAISGTGAAHSIQLAQNPATATEIFYTPTRLYLGEWAVSVFKILVVTGSFACGMAFHNCAARYLYAIGRENLFPILGRTIGRTHVKHSSPHIASAVQSVICAVVVAAFYFAHKDPYADLYALFGILGTMGVLIVQALCAFAIINYFHGKNRNQPDRHWFKTFTAPLLGGIGMLYVVYLLFANLSFAAGDAANSIVFKMIPWIVLGSFVLGSGIALYLKRTNHKKYLVIGSITLDESPKG
ncbi:APC family permease [Pseudomonas aeruginosa]|uniref:APC family permease n=1 Tax=Pseudomonas aeruginosa TaxID=287 RepID=UPI000F51F7DF|nr:APC family permease [Pseudomonas aeruginosa]MCS7970490.1 APC family permease [Pseudomonas aeruginosa]MCS8138624.1 APC family permease [Pseudomonas aeruginosa]MCS8181015.1 APC family permease [Pseudomonas aeruginosa]MCS8193662.1 APC family permease [Pseudomonas aeruginosa]MCT0923073.1 APC family permease [Pseudomonas aeruginosa]